MSTRRVYLDKDLVIELLARIWQTERAVHGLSAIHWPNLLNFYTPERLKELRETVAHVQERLGPDAVNVKDAVRPASLLPSPEPRLLGRIAFAFLDLYYGLCYPLFNRLKSRWAFKVPELCFMLNRIEALFPLLELAECPDFSVLVPLRMDLTECRILIDCRCYGVKEIKQASEVEYFNKTPWLKTIPLSDIIHPPKKSAA